MMLRRVCALIGHPVISSRVPVVRISQIIGTSNARTCYVEYNPMPIDQGKVRKDVDPNETYVDVEKSTAEWKYVEKLLGAKSIPKPPDTAGPSGWQPVNVNASNLSYAVERTKFHMLPVYTKINVVGPQKYTVIKRINGDIWKLQEDARAYLEVKYEKQVPTLVNEFGAYVVFKGDYNDALREWLHRRGF